ncbi:MAG: DUF1206 domain-containing protein [Nocardioides sp.]|nr:DUF1206 domain-containing protein [Nocardioides sp.]
MSNVTGRAKQLGRNADDSDWLDHVARAGLVAFGVVHLVVGWLAVQLALGDRSGSASTSGAVTELAQQPFGVVMVWLVAIGMGLLAIWQLIEAVLGHRDRDGITLVRKRATSAGKAVLYAVIAFSALKVATGQGSGDSEQKTDTMTAQVMDLPGGQVLVGLIGVGILVVAVMLVRKGVTDRFLKDIHASGDGATAGAAYTWLGRVGYTAKGVALGVVGGLFGYAALTHDANKSAGLDQALKEVLEQPFGPVLLTAIGLGFACFGAFCFAWARHLDR